MTSSKNISVRTGLGLPHLEAAHRLHPVLSSALKKAINVPKSKRGPYWLADFFGLTACDEFKEASDAQQNQILKLCSDGLLYEAYYIEKSGMAYAAKMSLLSETTEERMLYSLFASEEASHFEMIRAFVARPPADEPSNPFLGLLSELIESGDRTSLIFVIQIVLEGWGITHYRRIAAACEDSELKVVLEHILKDEARHHGSGMVLFEAESMNTETRECIAQVMTKFLYMIRLGPQSVVAAIETVLGQKSPSERAKIYESLKGGAHSEQRLNEIKQLMIKANANDLVEELASAGAFSAFSAEECAA